MLADECNAQEHFAIHIHIESTQNTVYEYPIPDTDI